jgi:hypothetical protein
MAPATEMRTAEMPTTAKMRATAKMPTPMATATETRASSMTAATEMRATSMTAVATAASCRGISGGRQQDRENKNGYPDIERRHGTGTGASRTRDLFEQRKPDNMVPLWPLHGSDAAAARRAARVAKDKSLIRSAFVG